MSPVDLQIHTEVQQNKKYPFFFIKISKELKLLFTYHYINNNKKTTHLHFLIQI